MKLNLGGGDCWNETGWLNLDIALGYDLSKELLREFGDNTVELVYTSHCLEHLRHPDVTALLHDVYRTLVPGGIIRIVVPDIDILSDVLCRQGYAFLERNNPHYYSTLAAKETPIQEHIKELVGWHSFDPSSKYGEHKSVWSASILRMVLTLLGFKDIRKLDFCLSSVIMFTQPAVMSADGGMPVGAWDNPNTKAISLFMEAHK